MPFQLLDFFKLAFDFPDRFEVVLRDRRRRAAEQSIVRLDLEPQVVRTIGHDDFPKHPPPISGAGGPVRGHASGYAAPVPVTWPAAAPRSISVAACSH
ncbi:MAG: hypothetical protein KGI92_10050 [Alphaproteobacteria bacterium]|nr:hypothetical protein [Alphaproteobacteria bacterium]